MGFKKYGYYQNIPRNFIQFWFQIRVSGQKIEDIKEN